jgi:ABC-type enterochelin transport system permease subunit
MLPRTRVVNVLMLLFIVLTSVGVALVAPSAGWGLVVAGVTSGIFGFLLGLE